MSCKSALYAAMQTPTAVAVGGVIPLGGLIRRYGCDIALNGNAVNLAGTGYYDVDASITAPSRRPELSPSPSTRTAWPSPAPPPPRPARPAERSTSISRRWCVSPAALQVRP